MAAKWLSVTTPTSDKSDLILWYENLTPGMESLESVGKGDSAAGDENFIRSIKNEAEENGTRHHFWNVGEQVMEKTRSRMLELKPEDTHICTTKVMIDVFYGSIKASYPASSPSTEIRVKCFERKDGMILIEATKERPVTISQDRGIDTGFVKLQEGQKVKDIKLDMTIPRCPLAVIRIGWLKPEFAE